METVSVSCPVTPALSQTSRSQGARGGDGRPHVVLVDDDPILLPLVSELLTDEGCTVATASTGEAGIHLLRTLGDRRPDVIVTDWRLTDMDGGCFIARYRTLPGPHAPVVVLTADSKAAQQAPTVGAASVVEKPFQVLDLLRVLAAYTTCIAV